MTLYTRDTIHVTAPGGQSYSWSAGRWFGPATKAWCPESRRTEIILYIVWRYVSSSHLGGYLGDEEGRVPVGHGGVQAVAHVHRDIDQLICSVITSDSVIVIVIVM